MRRVRRTRITEANKNQVFNQLKLMALADEKILTYLATGQRNRAFGRLLNKHMDSSQESVIDRYVDEEATEITSYVLNTVYKHLYK